MSAKKQNSEPSDSNNKSHVCVATNTIYAGSDPLLRQTSSGATAGLSCALVVIAGISLGGARLHADTAFADAGLTRLQSVAPNLDGAGVVIGDVEAGTTWPNGSGAYFEPNPTALGLPVSDFTFVGLNGNVSQGVYSAASYFSHSEEVGAIFYGSNTGIASGASQIYVYDESYYFQMLSAPTTPSNGLEIPAVVNQSFNFAWATGAAVQTDDSLWDNYAAANNTLFVNSIGDGESTTTTYPSYVNPPATMYNGIAVGVYNGSVEAGTYGPSSGDSANWVGPTSDGRSKPDLVAPIPNIATVGAYTSFSTPVVSGIASLIVQAGRGTGLSAPVGLGASDSSVANGSLASYSADATDTRTVKALLLNGAVKPVGWTNSYVTNNTVQYRMPTISYLAASANATTPLDPRYGSGVVNAYNSYENLAGGEHNYSSATSQSIAALPSVTSSPAANFSGSVSEAASTTNPATVTGWNLATIAATSTSNAVENYDFNLTGTSVNSWDLTATLTWNKDYNASGINHLMLFLLNSSGQQVASSTSMLDNVQQININPALGINSLAPGQYDLAVEMLGGVNAISTSDTYALAWNFVDPTSVPEPAALATFAIGLAMFMLPRKRKAVTVLGSIKQ